MELAMAAFGGLSAMMPAMSTVGSVLQGTATAGSVLMSLMGGQQSELAGRAQAADYGLQSQMLSLDRRQAENESQAREIELRRDALKKIGAARVAFGAVGGSAHRADLAETEIGSNLDYALGIEKTNRKLRDATAGLNQVQLSIRADSAIEAGDAGAKVDYLGAAVKGAEGLLSIVKRKSLFDDDDGWAPTVKYGG